MHLTTHSLKAIYYAAGLTTGTVKAVQSLSRLTTLFKKVSCLPGYLTTLSLNSVHLLTDLTEFLIKKISFELSGQLIFCKTSAAGNKIH